MQFEQIKALDETYLAHTYGRYPIAFCGGKNATLEGVDGKKYIDFGAGIAVNLFGVNDEAWKTAVKAQLDSIQHVSNYYYSEPTVRLAELVCRRAGAQRVFFGNSGAEANECAFKAARKYSFMKYGAGRSDIISLRGSFHGRTLFTLTATGQDAFHKYFDPFAGGVVYADADIASVEKAAEHACAVVIECVQGEGGVKALPEAFVKALAAFCAARDILLICDEVQCGMGRTGKFSAYEHYGITPDLVTLAKGLAGGLPIGACLFYEKTKDVFAPGDHGSTFGGNPVACAGGISVVSRITDGFLEEVEEKSRYLRKGLKEIFGEDALTGLGLMIGIRTALPAKEVAQKCLEKGLLVLTAHDLVRLLPPLSITKQEIDEGLRILGEVIS